MFMRRLFASLRLLGVDEFSDHMKGKKIQKKALHKPEKDSICFIMFGGYKTWHIL
jgi:hypothetical protein